MRVRLHRNPHKSTSPDEDGLRRRVTLQRFFDHIQQRSTQNNNPQPATGASPATCRIVPEPVPPPEAEPEVELLEIDRGMLRGRAYVLFEDGSMEVVTRLGNRRFSKLHDALDFIGEHQRLAG